jgi:hypothetical protein
MGVCKRTYGTILFCLECIFVVTLHLIWNGPWGSYIDNTNIRGIVWLKYGHLIPPHPGSPCIGLPPGPPSPVLQIILKKCIILCLECRPYIIVVTFHYQMIQIGKFFWDNSNIWGYFWSKCRYLTNRAPMYMIIPTVLQSILNKYHHALYWMYICGHFALSNGTKGHLFW